MLEALAVVAAALVLDMVLGDPRNRYHPTAWVGRVMAAMVPRAHGSAHPRAAGAAVVLAAVAAAAAPVALLYAVPGAAGSILVAVAGAVLLKTTLAVRGMGRHAMDVAGCVERGDMDAARARLSMITKRPTSGLDSTAVLSGAVESVGENTVDGATGPLFYYALFGLPGAFAYRAASTADSMMGYRSEMFREVGWFAARCDDVLSYAPARLTGLAMVAAAALLRKDWRGAYHAMARDGPRTPSVNSGYAMAAMAGALGTRLEKAGSYSLGGGGGVSVRHVREAVSVMRVAVALFACMYVAPLAALACAAGWCHA